MIIQLSLLAMVCLIIAFAFGCRSKHENLPPYPHKNLYLSTDSESQARANKVLPSKGSEDAKYILGDMKLEPGKLDVERKEYLPDECVEWVIGIDFPQVKTADAKELFSLFNKSFRDKFGSCTLYGKDMESGLWTFLISADGPQNVTDLKISYDYNQSWNSEFKPAMASEYEARFDAVKSIVAEHIGDCELEMSKSCSEAAHYSEKLSGLNTKYNKTLAIYLVADNNKLFDGKEIWDVMLCLGLKWGDMDCFHWVNDGAAGDDYFFSVETSTSPGYFLPEQIAAGKLQTSDLIFVFNLPRTIQPVDIFKRMDKAVQYCQQRLGGSIHYTLGEDELSMQVLIERVIQIESELKEIGFKPGTDSALRLF